MKQTSFGTAVLAIIWKDLRIERHTWQTISIMLMFSLVTVVMFNFALETDMAAVRNVSTGLLWATIVLAVILGLNRSLSIERENQTMDALLMAPIERSAIYVGKVASVTLFSLALEAILVIIFMVFFNKPYWRPPILLVLALGTLGYVAAGVLITSMTIQARTRDVLLPALLLPLSLPLVLPAAVAVSAYAAATPPLWVNVQSSVSLVATYTLLMLAIGFFAYNYVAE
ncbi:MAG: heme exporter protein CcmB [Chloroflexota bacterium]